MANPEANSITFHAEIVKVQTLADGGIRLTLDMPETEIAQMAMLAECKRQGMYLVFEATSQQNPQY